MVSSLSITQGLSIWAPFAVAVLLSWLIAEHRPRLSHYYLAVFSTAVLTAILAVRVLICSRRTAWVIAGVVIGLAIGERRILEAAIMTMFWQFRGFAP